MNDRATSKLPPLDLAACSKPRTDLLLALGIDEPEIELESIAIRVELDTPLNELFESIRQAASELEGQGAKSDRIAEQLLYAMAKFCRETGCL